MNYLREINAFEKQMRRRPLSPTAQLLWYKLMQTANNLFWPETFQMDNQKTLEALNTASIHKMIEARRELIEAGYILFRPGVKGKPSWYRLCSAAAMEEPETLPYYGESDAQAPDAFLHAVREDGDLTLYFGWDETVSRELCEITDILFAEYLPDVTPTIEDRRRVFYFTKRQEQTEDGVWEITFPEESKELLAYAFEVARENHRITWNYINGIYQNFEDRGIKTREAALEYEERWRQQKAQGGSP